MGCGDVTVAEWAIVEPLRPWWRGREAQPPHDNRLFLTDKGHDGYAVRSALYVRGILPVILLKTNRERLVACDFRANNARNQIERMFNRLSRQSAS